MYALSALGGKPAAAPSAAPRAGADANAVRPADPVDKLLTAGWEQLGMVNYAAAREMFEQVLKGQASPRQQAEATFALGHLWQYRRPEGDLKKARDYYQKVKDEYADTLAGPLAWMALARSADAPEYEKDRDRDRARELYREILARYPKHFVADEAALRLAMTYLEDRGRAESEDTAVRILTSYLAAKPDNLVAPIMHYELGELYQRRGDYRGAVEEWIAGDQADEAAGRAEKQPAKSATAPVPAGSQAASVPARHAIPVAPPAIHAITRSARAGLYYKIARVAEKHLKDYATAAKWYQKLVDEIPRDNKYYIAKLSAEDCRGKAAAAAGASTAPGDGTSAGKEGRP